jgi:hypothetical protein
LQLVGALCDERLILRVHRDEMAGGRGRRERGRERARIEMRELRNAAWTQECFETDDAVDHQVGQRCLIRSDQAAPQCVVHDRRARGARFLRAQRGRVDRRRKRVERHVGERGYAAGRRAARRSPPALPLLAAGLVHMGVRVDDTREDVKPARFDLVEGLSVARLDDRVEDPAGDQDVRLVNAFLGDDTAAADRQVCGGRSRPLR